MALRDGFRLEGAYKRLGRFTLGPIDLRVRAGEIVAVVGANGAGKTTLLDLISGSMRPDRGRIELAAGSGGPQAVACGYVMDESVLPGDLAAAELFSLAAGLVSAGDRAARRRIEGEAGELAAALDFREHDKPIRSMSHGNHQKVKLVLSLMVSPRALLLDEPRNGLDPPAIDALTSLVAQRARAGIPILIATHDLYYARRAADEIIVLAGGRLVARLAPDEVTEQQLHASIATTPAHAG